mmetsp:Transcript_99395/g.176267  ORF Transcript_99395/g.176267 Transcript_99395/m.176267 type:complete len:202 (+) Transcript_99395:749-1354(+)
MLLESQDECLHFGGLQLVEHESCWTGEGCLETLMLRFALLDLGWLPALLRCVILSHDTFSLPVHDHATPLEHLLCLCFIHLVRIIVFVLFVLCWCRLRWCRCRLRFCCLCWCRCRHHFCCLWRWCRCRHRFCCLWRRWRCRFLCSLLWCFLCSLRCWGRRLLSVFFHFRSGLLCLSSLSLLASCTSALGLVLLTGRTATHP